jgi:hypothetical protein
MIQRCCLLVTWFLQFSVLAAYTSRPFGIDGEFLASLVFRFVMLRLSGVPAALRQPETPLTEENERVDQESHRGPQNRGDATRLANARTAALDYKTQHDDEQRTGDNPDKHCLVHIDLLSLSE